MNFYHKALAISESLEDRQAVADVYSKIGRAYIHVNKPALAEEAIQKSISDSTLVMSGTQFYQLGELYFDQGRFEDGKNYVLQAIEYFVQLDDFVHLASCYKLLITHMGEQVPADYVNKAADYLDKIGKRREATVLRRSLEPIQDGKLEQRDIGDSPNDDEDEDNILDLSVPDSMFDEPEDQTLERSQAEKELDELLDMDTDDDI